MNRPQNNTEIRKWYREQLSNIPELNEQWIKQGVSLEERAFMAWEFRHDTRQEARAMMQDAFEVELLRRRDLAKYGTPDGPTFEYLVARLQSRGLAGNAVFEAIIKGSSGTDPETDEMLGF